jgi:hypothetical protein
MTVISTPNLSHSQIKPLVPVRTSTNRPQPSNPLRPHLELVQLLQFQKRKDQNFHLERNRVGLWASRVQRPLEAEVLAAEAAAGRKVGGVLNPLVRQQPTVHRLALAWKNVSPIGSPLAQGRLVPRRLVTRWCLCLRTWRKRQCVQGQSRD